MVRNALREHSSKITVTFTSDKDVFSDCARFADELMNEAMSETDDPSEGDYIRYQCGGYESSFTCDSSDRGYMYSISISPKYYVRLAQEETVNEKLSEILEGFGFDENTTDHDKIKTIYDYVCGSVSYDKVHRKNPYYCMRSTAYAALIQKTATCQGYCVAMYRLLRQSGINARIVIGEGSGEDSLHAWNIVELDGVYYNLDATWDAGKTEYDFFLKGSEDFPDHTPAKEFTEASFRARYPMAKRAYDF